MSERHVKAYPKEFREQVVRHPTTRPGLEWQAWIRSGHPWPARRVREALARLTIVALEVMEEKGPKNMAACAGPTGEKAEGASPLNERPKPSRLLREPCATVRQARVSRCVPSKLL